MARPKISVITPSFNQGRYIRDTIESVIAQNYHPFEHIIIDGGSTDNTVDILKSYPHLQWSSAPDKGQSDALNKGMAKAAGDIIAWINSDDLYAEGAFETAAAELETYPVVMGSCAIVNADLSERYEVPNFERTWFDLMRYWIAYPTPTQPALFFRRELLAGLERAPGEMFDPELYYTMDYDLWTRIAIRTPFLKRVQKRFAYYRMTETNKTNEGTDWLSFAEPEMARVFKRAETTALAPSTQFSFIVPVDTLSEDLRRTVESILHQSSRDFEVVLVGKTPSPVEARNLKGFVKEINKTQNSTRHDSYLRFIESTDSSYARALAAGVDAAEGRYVVVGLPGALFGRTFAADAAAALASNRLGLILPWRHSHEVFEELGPIPNFTQKELLDFDAFRLFRPTPLPLALIARRVALLECTNALSTIPTQKMIRELIATIIFKGWQVSLQRDIEMVSPVATAEDRAYLSKDHERMVAEIVLHLETLRREEPFSRMRVAHGYGLSFPPEVIERCKAMLTSG